MTSFLNNIPKKKKSSEQLIISIKQSLETLIEGTWESEDFKISIEQRLSKNVTELKVIICGDSEHHEFDDEKIRELCKHMQNEDLILLVMNKLDMISFDVRKDLTSIITSLVRRNIQNVSSYLTERNTVIKALTEHYMHYDAAMSCGVLLRECIRYENLAKYILYSDLIWQFFDTYVHLPNFDVASDAFNTLKELLTTPKNKQISADFLETQYEKFVVKYEILLHSDNYVTTRRSLKLLSELLTDRCNYNVMMRYISSRQNLKTVMNLLKNKSANIQFEAFHVFKIFVANPNKSKDITTILSQNRVKLVAYLEAFHLDREDPQFVDEKRLIIETLSQLEEVPHMAKDISFSSPVISVTTTTSSSSSSHQKSFRQTAAELVGSDNSNSSSNNTNNTNSNENEISHNKASERQHKVRHQGHFSGETTKDTASSIGSMDDVSLVELAISTPAVVGNAAVDDDETKKLTDSSKDEN